MKEEVGRKDHALAEKEKEMGEQTSRFEREKTDLEEALAAKETS